MDIIPICVILGAHDVGRVHGTVSYLDIRMLLFCLTPVSWALTCLFI